MIYGELGRFPLFVNSHIRCIKYFRLLQMDQNRFPRQAYQICLLNWMKMERYAGQLIFVNFMSGWFLFCLASTRCWRYASIVQAIRGGTLFWDILFIIRWVFCSRMKAKLSIFFKFKVAAIGMGKYKRLLEILCFAMHIKFFGCFRKNLGC